jgi:peroxin-6
VIACALRRPTSPSPDLLDTALLRPGRFDKMVYLGTNVEVDGRLKILRALTRKFQLAKDVDLEALAASLPPSYTGADSYGLCANALLRAVKRRCHELQDTVDAGVCVCRSECVFCA